MMDDILQEYMGRCVFAQHTVSMDERCRETNVQFDSAGMRRMSTHNSGKDLAVVTHDRKMTVDKHTETFTHAYTTSLQIHKRILFR